MFDGFISFLDFFAYSRAINGKIIHSPSKPYNSGWIRVIKSYDVKYSLLNLYLFFSLKVVDIYNKDERLSHSPLFIFRPTRLHKGKIYCCVNLYVLLASFANCQHPDLQFDEKKIDNDKRSRGKYFNYSKDD